MAKVKFEAELTQKQFEKFSDFLVWLKRDEFKKNKLPDFPYEINPPECHKTGAWCIGCEKKKECELYKKNI